jgi:CRP-like cAMP-binding protein
MIEIMPDPLDQFFADVGTRTLSAGEFLFHAGDPVQQVGLLRAGQVMLVRHGADGSRMILQRAEPGDLLAEASVWSDVYHCDAVVRSPAEVAMAPRSAFLAALARDPSLAEGWARRLARAVQAARLRAEIRGLRTVAERLDAWLGADSQLPDRGRWQELAEELGVTREALYRELARRRALAAPG